MSSISKSVEVQLIISTFSNIICHYWYIFVAYLFFNIVDWITGMLKSIKLKELSSSIGFNVILKKFGLWLVIIIAFFISYLFIAIGNDILHIDLSVMYLIGWYTIISLLINELISILENLVALKINVPTFLIKSLKATNHILRTNEKNLFKNIR